MMRNIFILPLSLLFCQCASFHEERSRVAADNSIMLVMQQPPSLGFKRIQSQQARRPEFAAFLSETGIPDAIAETTQADRHYMILYFLESRQAFSCRTDMRDQSRPMQVSGPYPISDRELKILSDFQNNAYNTLSQ